MPSSARDKWIELGEANEDKQRNIKAQYQNNPDLEMLKFNGDRLFDGVSALDVDKKGDKLSKEQIYFAVQLGIAEKSAKSEGKSLSKNERKQVVEKEFDHYTKNWGGDELHRLYSDLGTGDKMLLTRTIAENCDDQTKMAFLDRLAPMTTGKDGKPPSDYNYDARNAATILESLNDKSSLELGAINGKKKSVEVHNALNAINNLSDKQLDTILHAATQPIDWSYYSDSEKDGRTNLFDPNNATSFRKIAKKVGGAWGTSKSAADARKQKSGIVGQIKEKELELGNLNGKIKALTAEISENEKKIAQLTADGNKDYFGQGVQLKAITDSLRVGQENDEKKAELKKLNGSLNVLNKALSGLKEEKAAAETTELEEGAVGAIKAKFAEIGSRQIEKMMDNALFGTFTTPYAVKDVANSITDVIKSDPNDLFEAAESGRPTKDSHKGQGLVELFALKMKYDLNGGAGQKRHLGDIDNWVSKLIKGNNDQDPASYLQEKDSPTGDHYQNAQTLGFVQGVVTAAGIKNNADADNAADLIRWIGDKIPSFAFDPGLKDELVDALANKVAEETKKTNNEYTEKTNDTGSGEGKKNLRDNGNGDAQRYTSFSEVVNANK